MKIILDINWLKIKYNFVPQKINKYNYLVIMSMIILFSLFFI